MKFPLYTYDDGTEVTASSIHNGKTRVYTEKWDQSRDMFIHAEIMIPDGTIISSDGYTEDEVKSMVKIYRQLASDIIEYIQEKESEGVIVSA